ncbi:MAG: hypothetical protein EOL89_10470 [Actinobacteria bacterium]|nr:hypothetical protein [Actinomycetota bacterium]
MKFELSPVALLGASLTALLLAGCSGVGGSADEAGYNSASCRDALATAIQRERTGDASGAVTSDGWLSDNCSTEIHILTDYRSARAMAEQSGPDSCNSWTQYINEETVDLLRQDGLCTSDVPAPAAEVPAVEVQPGGGIAWDQAKGYVGSTQRVCGPLVNMGNSHDDVFLNIGLGYPDPERFTIVLWDVGGVEPIAPGTMLCTSGVITLYQDVAQIQQRSASSVELYG